MTIQERIFLLSHHGMTHETIAAIIGADVEDVISVLEDPIASVPSLESSSGSPGASAWRMLYSTTAWPATPAELSDPGHFGDLFLVDYTNQFDLTGYSEVRLVVYMQNVGSEGSEVRARYLGDDGVTWGYADGISGPTAPMDGEQNELKASPWVPLLEDAKTDRQWKLVTIGGDGVTEPHIYWIDFQAR